LTRERGWLPPRPGRSRVVGLAPQRSDSLQGDRTPSSYCSISIPLGRCRSGRHA